MDQLDKPRCKRKKLFANKLHEQTFLMVFTATLLPAFVVTMLLYYLIFQITAEHLTTPEIITYSLLPAAQKVMSMLLISAPIIVAVLLVIAHKLTHSLFGPFDRILRELDDRLATNKKEPIIIRKTDKFLPLVERINKLLQR